jgi:hypothetical protein
VKITVIATGFREVPAMRRRTPEVHGSFAATHNDHMDFPEPEPAPAPRFEPDPMPVPERIMMEDTMSEPTVGMAQVQPDSLPIDLVRSSMAANFEQDNLDVPAFLRKRGDVM